MELLPLVCLCLLSCSGDAVRVVVEEDSDAVLPCLISTKRNLAGKVFEWRKDVQKEKKEVFLYDGSKKDANKGQDEQFKGRVSHFEDQLQNGNASIKIQNTKMADSGNYSCDFPGFELSQIEIIIELVVDPVLRDRTGEKTGLAPEPCISTLEDTKGSSVLQCEADGVPPPTVEWKDSAGKTLPAEEPQISEREGRSYVTVNITVTNSDDYRCVATQETLSHQVTAVTSVYIQGLSAGEIAGYVILILLLVVVGVPAGLYLKNRITQNPTTDKKKSDGEERNPTGQNPTTERLNQPDPEK